MTISMAAVWVWLVIMLAHWPQYIIVLLFLNSHDNIVSASVGATSTT